ncbi:MAG: protein-methionine-sulfoxide reductase catalytic subunit MsrP [Moraxellaceae bacterium]|nr:MAG: protein-methionine-sulfoxide reductase catalytic subunit MsrP [Moraxellaceae bacterium]
MSNNKSPLIIVPPKNPIRSSEITAESAYLSRRQLMASMLGGTLIGSAHITYAAPSQITEENPAGPAWLKEKLLAAKPARAIAESITPYKHITQYNNFYEFGTAKTDPAKNAHSLKPDPWRVTINGAVDKPGQYFLDDLLKGIDLEERIYRLRCVEAWSMVIPWVGFSLSEILKKAQPTSSAKYVAFTTLLDKDQMPEQKSRLSTINWPYQEGLRIDEAMHPLCILAVGLYGKVLPNQNGAPLRLVVPWKYGFKSIKSIVGITLMEKQPQTSWNILAPQEYGFYANVNPQVDHPRWSQAKERRLPNSLLNPNIIPTQMFNGYSDEVASLYSALDLKKLF